MAILADTNILLRSLYPDHPHYSVAENALSALRLRNETLCIAAQNLIDFWAVATRSREDNGLGMTTLGPLAKSQLCGGSSACSRPLPMYWKRGNG